jgi:hypothetical protein
VIEEGVLSLANQATADTFGGRFYADTLPDKVTYPAGVMHAGIGGSASPTFDTAGMQRIRYQFDFAGKSRRDAVLGREAVVAALDGFYGVTPSGDYIEDIEFIQPIGLPYDSDKLVYWCACEFYVKFTR